MTVILQLMVRGKILPIILSNLRKKKYVPWYSMHAANAICLYYFVYAIREVSNYLCGSYAIP